ncbi:MAG: Ldh family oxidoreductase [Leptolyngbyaceae cyanobacterium MO_188.B28]|nr:Ldh family oxidoreductase [Leptolyngbyaceae cyanobacterium MO_188.B28]
MYDAANGTDHLFLALDVSAWTDLAKFEQGVQRAIAELKATPRLNPHQAIHYPGERETSNRTERMQTGIPLPKFLMDALAEQFGADCMSALTQ